MANSKGRSSSGSRKRTSSSKRGSSKRRTNNSRNSYNEINPDIIVLLAIVLGVFLFLCNIKKVGDFGTVVSNIEFGLFGISAYAVPFLLIAFVFVSYLARENYIIRKRLICSSVIFAFMNIMFEECGGIIRELSEYSIGDIWNNSVNAKSGGGVIFGSIAYMMHKYLSTAGTIFICLIGCVICILIFLGREAIDGFKANSRQIYDTAREDAAYRKQVRNEQRDADRAAYEESLSNVNPENVVEEKYVPRYARKRRGIGTFEDKPVEEYNGEELTEVDKTPRRDKKVSGVAQNTTLVPEKKKDDILNGMHEIIVDNSKNNAITETTYATAKEPFDSLASGEMLEISPIAPEEDMSEVIGQRGVVNMFEERVSPLKNFNSDSEQISDTYDAEDNHNIDNEFNSEPEFDALGGAHAISEQFSQTDVYDTDSTSVKPSAKVGSTASDTAKPVSKPAVKRPRKKYIMPSTQLLKDMVNAKNGNINAELNDVAHKLMTTLDTFGVKAKLEGYSRGPAVTRFEIQPELGVRVNKITSLQDDIKLSLAATDIRIEAPIPGKSAVGIEIPNKTSEGVGLKELLDDREFKNFNSKIAFAVGKDISGNVVVTDIGKMPHMLIAGTTGSGKSVCINTLIMSVLYKATPDEVKFIMIDPKVVELGVYNGIPHLLIPVVTDPRKASAALNWAVNEMMRRYQLFAEKNVRDLKGYNSAIEGEINPNDPEAPVKLPQLVIIVDELADLMMVAAKEVEDSICRLAQLARACGIHLIIATQRPSVDVITGLIKANMPSRVAFAVNSGTDSRTILDMNGAEKLLGKGDMLFYPQGYPKPVRVQGAFVSDAEIGKVVEFITNQDYVTDGQEDLLIKMETASSGSGSASGQATSEGNDLDELFTLAGQFIIDTDKASIGALQRKFKIGFNRAARIMDQLTEAGVVSEEDGKKPRTVLMGPEQFEQYVEEYV